MVYLITGKAGAGKTHYASALAAELKQEDYKVLVIDGDEFRDKHDNDDYSDEGRIKNLMGIAKLAKDFEDQGYIVIVACVSPRREWRNMMRQQWIKSRVIYIPGGSLWEGTRYEVPEEHELEIKIGTMVV